jgi:hypothetical protein
MGGGRVVARVEVLLDRDPRLVRHLDDALSVTLAPDPQAVGLPVAAIQAQHLGDPRAR